MNRSPSEIPPPWHVFPKLRPEELGATQGAEEAYMDQEWRPFWSGLDEAKRCDYLDYWNASPASRDAIRFLFENATALDVEADAAESKAYLEKQRRQREQQPSLLERWFKPRNKR